MAAGAVPPETVTLTNGTVYMGHTSVKNLIGGYSAFMVDSAIIVVNDEDADCSPSDRRLDELNQRWKAWFAVHPQYVKKLYDGSDYARMYSLSLKDRNVSDVVLLEKGDNYMKYIDMTQSTVNVPDSVVLSYNYAPRGGLDISGVVDEVFTTDGKSYTGQILAESPRGLGILTDELVTEFVSWDKLRRTKKRPLYDRQAFDEQVEYYDNIRTKDGSRRGIITEINYKPGENDKPYYVVREKGSVNEFKVPFDDAQEISLVRNPDYKPLSDVRIESVNDILANGIKLNKVKYESFKGDSNRFIIPADSIPMKIGVAKGDKLKVQMKEDAVNSGALYLIPLEAPAELPKSRDDKKYYFFSFNDLINKGSQPVRSISPYKNVTLSYEIAPGTYLIYRQSDKSAYLITIS